MAMPTAALASGFDAPTIGSAQSGPVSNDAAAVWWNPGRLGYLKNTELMVGAGVIVGSVGYQRDFRAPYQFSDNLDFAEPIDPANIDPNKHGKAGKVRAVPVGPALDAFFAIPAIRDRLVFGLGVSIPYVAVLNFPKSGPQRFAGQSIFLATPHATLAMAVKAHDVISIGAGISYVLGTMSLSKIQDFGAVGTFGDALARPPIGQANDFGPNAPSTVRELDVLARPIEINKAFAHGVTFNAGIALQPTKKLSIGLVYHHGARLTFNGRFKLDMNDEFFTQDLAAQGLQYPPIVNGKARIKFRIPKRITLGLGYQITKRFALDGFVAYVFYQDFDKIRIRLSSPDLAQEALGVGPSADQDLVRNWKGTVNTELNARIDATEKLRVSVTAGYNSPASPNSTIDVLSPDGHRLIFGTGLIHRFNERIAILADVETQFIVPRTVTGSQYDLGNGRYNLFIAAATLHGQFRFAGPKQRKGAKKSELGPSGKSRGTKGESKEPTSAPKAAPASEPTPATEPVPQPSEVAPDPAPKTPGATVPPPPPPPPPPGISVASLPRTIHPRRSL